MSEDEGDLDDFFNEIEETVAEVKEEEATSAAADDKNGKHKKKNADDDDDDQQSPPPAKKQKTNSAPPVRPKGVVVAAASSVAKPKQPDPIVPTEGSNTSTAASVTTASQSNKNMNIAMNGLPTAGPSYPQPTIPGVSSLPPMPPGGLLQPPLPPGPVPPPNGANAAGGSGKPVKRMAAGKVWVDPTLDEWPENDFRIFVGNISGDVTDQQLYDHYTKYASLAKAKIVRDHKQQSKGYGFVSFLQPLDCAKAIRETDQSWLGARPIRVKRSDWKDRNFSSVMKHQKKDKKQKKRYGGF
jgi:hypothetical protein